MNTPIALPVPDTSMAQRHAFRRFSVFAMATLALVFASGVAWADLRLCNRTDSNVGVAIGYKDEDGWTSEGWWNIPPHECKTLLEGPLIARYYYVFAVDYDKGGSWGGPATLCTRNKIFTIRGRTNCEARGFRTTGFFEVDTGEESDWTITLSGEATTPPARDRANGRGTPGKTAPSRRK